MQDVTTVTVQSYEKTAEQYAQKTKDLHPKAISDIFASRLSTGAHVLDLGCGSGRDAQVFVERGFRVTGVDLSKNLIALAQAVVPTADFLIMDMTKLDFPPDHFYGVWANASLLHLPKQEVPSVLRRLKHVMKPNGILHIALKKGEGESLITDSRYGGVQKYLALYSEDEIAQYLDEAGFLDIEFLTLETEQQNRSYATHQWFYVLATS